MATQDGSSTSDRIKQLQQERSLLQWMIDNQKRVNNGIGNYLKSKRQILVLEQQIQENAAMYAKSMELITDLEKEKAGKSQETIKHIEKQIEEQKKFAKGVKKQLDDQKREHDLLKSTANVAKALTNELKEQVKKFSQQHFSVKQLLKTFLEYDKAIKVTKTQMGLTAGQAEILRDNLAAAQLEVAEFGISMAELAKVQREISSTIGRQVMGSSKLLKDMSILEKILPGIAMNLVDNVDTLYGGLSMTVELADQIRKDAASFGIDMSKMAGELAKNLKFATTLRFKDIKGDMREITRQMIRLKTDFGAIAGFAEKVFRPEGAIEAAAQLQVLGGAMANLGDPFLLMSKARNDVAGFTNEVLKATKFTGMWNEETKQFELTANELDRLRELSKITGQSMEDLTNQARMQVRYELVGDKLARFNLAPEDQEYIESISQMVNGKMSLMVPGMKEYTEVGKLTPSMIDSLKDDKVTKEKFMADSMTFMDRFDGIIFKLQMTLMPAFEWFADQMENKVIPYLNDFSIENFKRMAKAFAIIAAVFSFASFIGLGAAMGIGFKATSGIGGLKAGSGLGGAQALGAGKGQMYKMAGFALVLTSIGAAVLMIGKGVQFATKGFSELAAAVKELPVTHLEMFSGLVSTVMWSMTAMVGVLALVAGGLMAFGAAASTPVMWAAVGVLLAIGGAATLLGAGVWLAANGMATLVESMTGLMAIENVGTEMLLMGAGITAMAAGLTLMANPLALLGMFSANQFLKKMNQYGPGLQAAGTGVELLANNLNTLKSSLKGFEGDSGIFENLSKIDELVTRTQTKPIVVEVKGDLGGRLSVDIIGSDSERKILLADSKFLNKLTDQIENRLDIKENISGPTKGEATRY